MDNTTLIGTNTNAAAGILAGRELASQVATLTAEIKQYDEGRPYRVRPDGQIEIVERLCQAPTFRRGDVTFYEGLSFSRFVKRFRNLSTIIFADAVARRFTAVIDYHEGPSQEGAHWDLFRATLPMRHTPSWETWTAANSVPLDQETFAQFLEENIPDIVEPAGGQLVDIARTLEAKSDVQFESHIRADNGAHRFIFIENTQGTAKGTVTIPQEITLQLQPFEGSKGYQIKARFRYRIAGKKLSMWFELVRPQDVLQGAFDDELLKIEQELSTAEAGTPVMVTPVYNGPAPAAQQPSKAEA